MLAELIKKLLAQSLPDNYKIDSYVPISKDTVYLEFYFDIPQSGSISYLNKYVTFKDQRLVTVGVIANNRQTCFGPDTGVTILVDDITKLRSIVGNKIPAGQVILIDLGAR